jgi:hypothetical protein
VSKHAAQASATISLHEAGFVLHAADQPADAGRRFAWQEITSMIAYKRDLFASDLICLAIESNSTAVEIDEEYNGWDAFIKAAEENLPGSVPVETWWPAVAHPAFKTNPTTIYRREQPVA